MKRILVVLFGVVVATVMADKPNVIVIMADDMGYADAGFTGATDIQTPNLDALAESGVIFKQGYVTHPFCAPSRAGFLSGRYQHRFGFEHNPPYDPANPISGIDRDETLFPARMQTVGYTTGIIGKWHLGAGAPFNPMNRGFDYFYGFLTGGHDYYKIDLTKPVDSAYLQGLQHNTQPAGFEGYLTTALSRDAVKFVEDNKDNPFFLFLSFNAPHAPLQAPKEDIARYAHIKDDKRRVYAAMVDVMDQGIGEVIAALEKNGLRNNTLVFFLSDNGGPVPSKRVPHRGNGSSNGPFRGGKTDFYEGGVHVPFIASWPGKIKARQTYDFPVIALDISRTAVELAGADPVVGHEMEGVNLMPFLNGQTKEAPHDALFWRFFAGTSVVSSSGHKYIRNPDRQETELFYLTEDVGEQHDVKAELPELAAQLQKTWNGWNEGNVALRNPVYGQYYKAREDLFESTIPEEAREEGYHPEFYKPYSKK